MLKKYPILFILVSFVFQFFFGLQAKKITPSEALEPSSFITNKDQKFVLLNKIAEQVNRLAPLDEYTVTVPPFYVVTNQDMYQLLATIMYQSDAQPSKPKKRILAARATSVLDILEQTWKAVRLSVKKGKATTKTYQLLNDIRNIIEVAFNSSDLAFPNKKFTDFLQKAVSNNTPLITRMATDHPTLGPKSVYPAQATSIYRAIGDTLKTYYDNITFDQLLQQESLPTNFYATIIVQQFITEDSAAHPVVSGFCCSQDRISGAAGIAVIEAMYGQHAGFKQDEVMHDTYYVHYNTVIPVIRKKEYRLDPNMLGLYTSLTKNNNELIEAPTLDAHAAQEIAKITTLLTQYSNKPVCISFIKQHNTIYLIDFHYLSDITTKHATYIDPLYIKKAIKDGAVHIVSLKPLHQVTIVKKPQHILFAWDVYDLLQQYEKSTDTNEIVMAIIERKPSPWSKEQKIVENLPFITLWSSSPANIQQWTKQNSWPLVVDPQTQLMFPYKRRKNFCTLFQTVMSGLNGYPLPEHISIIDSFFVPLSITQKELLNPNEFFSGVSMEYLFGLLKNEQPETALQALRTIIYRLQTRIKRAWLTAEQSDPKQINMGKYIPELEKQYEHILTIAYKLYTIMYQSLKSGKNQSAKDQELLFLINILQKMIAQSPSDQTVNVISFNTLHAQTK